MAVGADEAARAGVRAWERLVAAIPGARKRREGGALGVITGANLADYNGVWGEAAAVDPGALARLLDEVRAADVPYGMQLRPGWPPGTAEIARERGLVGVSGQPLMVLEADGHLAEALAPDRLSLRVLAPDRLSLRVLAPEEGALHARVAAVGGVVPDEVPFRALMTPAVLGIPGFRAYVGEVTGEAVTTAIGMRVDDNVGIFNVATVPGHRRQGYGAAVTARAVSDGLEAGARWAWLMATPAGEPVYRALGFCAVERWDIWEQRAP